MADVAVIVPVLWRPHSAAPFVESLVETTELGQTCVYPIADADDVFTIEAWTRAGTDVLLKNFMDRPPGHPFGSDRPGTYAEKANYGYEHSTEPWLFIVGDDVRFHPEWLVTALEVAGDRYHVVGINDGVRGDLDAHAVHMLIRRSYVDEVGASWDGPGVLAHVGYAHWYVDNELVVAAKDRDVYVAAHGALVEHMHPAWQKGPNDKVYALGNARVSEDHAIFMSRFQARPT